MSEYRNRDNVKPPPLGEMRDLNKEESEQLLALNFEKIEAYAELKTTVTAATEELNRYRLSLGLAPIEIEDDIIRLIDEKNYDSDPFAKKQASEEPSFTPVTEGYLLDLILKNITAVLLKRCVWFMRSPTN